MSKPLHFAKEMYKYRHRYSRYECTLLLLKLASENYHIFKKEEVSMNYN